MEQRGPPRAPFRPGRCVPSTQRSRHSTALGLVSFPIGSGRQTERVAHAEPTEDHYRRGGLRRRQGREDDRAPWFSIVSLTAALAAIVAVTAST